MRIDFSRADVVGLGQGHTRQERADFGDQNGKEGVRLLGKRHEDTTAMACDAMRNSARVIPAADRPNPQSGSPQAEHGRDQRHIVISQRTIDNIATKA